VNLHLTEEQKLLRETLARVLRAESDVSRVRAAEASGFDSRLWSHLVEMGIPWIRVPESADGLGLGLFEAVLVAEEAGRRLAPVPLAEVLTAGSLLARLPGQAAAEVLAELRAGAVITLMPQELRPDEPQVLPAAAIATAVLALDGEDVILIEDLKRARGEPISGQTR
jgi:alkylation response protein AidB-like acyl-CoA dehydrogenase